MVWGSAVVSSLTRHELVIKPMTRNSSGHKQQKTRKALCRAGCSVIRQLVIILVV